MSYLGSTTWPGSRGLAPTLLRTGLIVVLLASAGCSAAQRAITIAAAPTEIEAPEETPSVPIPDPVRALPVTWRVVTPERVPEGSDWVLFAVDAKGYENLSRNAAEFLRWAEEADWQLRYYRGELEDVE